MSLIFSQFPLFLLCDGPDVSPLSMPFARFSINILRRGQLVTGRHSRNVFHHYVNARGHLEMARFQAPASRRVHTPKANTQTEKERED